MLLSIVLLSRALRTIPLGTRYAVWTGIGAVGTALVGILVLGEPICHPERSEEGHIEHGPLRCAQGDRGRPAENPCRGALCQTCGRPRQVSSATSRHQLLSWRSLMLSTTAAPARRSRCRGSR